LGVSSAIEAKAVPNTTSAGRMTRRGPKRSSSIPVNGAHTAAVMAAIPNAPDTDSRPQPKVSLIGLRKMPNV
jgi:hypothetical protein